jgi:hypothetical protein
VVQNVAADGKYDFKGQENLKLKHALICASRDYSGLYISNCPIHNDGINGKSYLKKMKIFKSKKKKKKKIPKPFWC